MEQVWRAALWILASFSLPIGIAIWVYAMEESAVSRQWALRRNPSNLGQVNCQTLIADPHPPLNIRSSPVVAADNKIASLPNGTTLTIVDEQNGWLRISSPLQGWVYKELTVTSCAQSQDTQAKSSVSPVDQGHQLLAIATEQYQSGKLDRAIALARTVAPESSAYQIARLFAPRWQQDWQTAEARYYMAQKALRDGRWQDVMNQVSGYPDIRYWREKLSLVVQQAIAQSESTLQQPIAPQ
jgi:hypothetical protein